jgi:hypothetical protein
MGEIPGNSPLFASLGGAVQYHYDVVESLRRYFNPDLPCSLARLDGFPRARIVVRPAEYIEETDLRSALAMLTLIDAAFKKDYRYRCENKLKDDLSRAFRVIHKRKPDYQNVNLEMVIFDAWSRHAPGERQLIGDLRGAFRFRNWLAHGRYWPPKLGRKYDFDYLFRLADAVYSTLPLRGMDEP